MTKNEVKELVNKYGMQELFNDEIRKEQIGYYLLADHYIDELDELADRAEKDIVGVTRLFFSPQSILYQVYVPEEWL